MMAHTSIFAFFAFAFVFDVNVTLPFRIAGLRLLSLNNIQICHLEAKQNNPALFGFTLFFYFDVEKQ